MQYKSLEYMIALQEEGFLSLAAKRLHISQSTLSLYLLRLEESFGTSFYDRKLHRMTEAGEFYCEGARKILLLHEKAVEDMKTHADRKSIHFGVDICISEIAPLLISRLLEEMAGAYPQITLQISFLMETRLRDMIQQKKLDLAFSYFQRSGIDNLERREIMAEPFLLAAPEGFRFPADRPFTAFNKLKYIAMFKDTSIRWACDAILFAQGIKPYIQVESGSYTFTRSLMETGLYLTIIPAGAADLFSRFQLLPLEPSVQAVSGFYMLREERGLPHYEFLMEHFERLLSQLYSGNSPICFPGGEKGES
ncbi:MAG: LysR family transcriptional regulator [Clostridium sp.]|nr:LysR family transcriptional regulator [Clostridium sp.]